MRNLQEHVKKAFCYQKLFWPFTVWINCSSDLKNFCKFSASNFKSFSWSLEQFFVTVGQNNFGIKKFLTDEKTQPCALSSISTYLNIGMYKTTNMPWRLLCVGHTHDCKQNKTKNLKHKFQFSVPGEMTHRPRNFSWFSDFWCLALSS